MELTALQTDALTELINIGYARAAAALSELTGHRISLEVPGVAVLPISEINSGFQGVVVGKVMSVHQVFSGAISGNGILLLDSAGAAVLNRLLTDRPDASEMDDEGREVIAEIGNILLNACLGAFGNLLKVQVSFTVPRLEVESVQNVLKSIMVGGNGLEYALIIQTHFEMRAKNVSGYLVIILGVTSLERLLLELKKWDN